MKLIQTNKEVLDEKDILKFIKDYEIKEVPRMDKLWEYYRGKNIKILGRKITDPNNPDNRISASYGRKIINTFVGYAYRPRFIKYKAIEIKDESEEKTAIIQADLYYQQIQDNFNLNNEHIKTSRAGRNTAIFGVAYEILYIDTQVKVGEQSEIINDNIPKFFSVDPREVVLLYDYSPEPKKKIMIRFYKVDNEETIVEVYYKDKVETYKKINKDEAGNQIDEKLVPLSTYINFFGEVPVIAYYMGDEMMGLIEPVLCLIDAYDVLLSDSMNEFDRFAFAYLIMKKFGLTDQVNKKAPGMADKADTTIRNLKRKRMFEHLPADADISFLTKDIPHEFIQFMTELLRNQIHIQSHVPDFTMMTGALSGAAVERLLFDFENIVSSAEADFDVGLADRIDLITIIYVKSLKGINGGHEDIVITHKRNLPRNNQEYADLAVKMKTAGFSRFSIADMMPDDLIPDVEKELERQDEDMESMLPDIENQNYDDVNKDDEIVIDEKIEE